MQGNRKYRDVVRGLGSRQIRKLLLELRGNTPSRTYTVVLPVVSVLATIILAIAGIVYTKHISDVSTKEIQTLVDSYTTQINRLVNESTKEIKKTSSEGVSEIVKALNPNDFSIHVYGSDDLWFRPSLTSVKDSSSQRVAFYDIVLGRKEFPFHFGIINHSEHPARDVKVFLSYDSSSFEESCKQFLTAFHIKNPGHTLILGDPNFGMSENLAFIIPQVTGLFKLHLEPIQMHLKRDTGLLYILVNANNLYAFRFIVKEAEGATSNPPIKGG